MWRNEELRRRWDENPLWTIEERPTTECVGEPYHRLGRNNPGAELFNTRIASLRINSYEPMEAVRESCQASPVFLTASSSRFYNTGIRIWIMNERRQMQRRFNLEIVADTGPPKPAPVHFPRKSRQEKIWDVDCQR